MLNFPLILYSQITRVEQKNLFMVDGGSADFMEDVVESVPNITIPWSRFLMTSVVGTFVTCQHPIVSIGCKANI